MREEKLFLIRLLAENYLRNPFFAIPLSPRSVDPLLHQDEVVARAVLLNPTRVLLADVIGLGKTIEALRILYALGAYQRLRRVLVIVPTVLEKQWEDELRRFGFTPRKLDEESLRELARDSSVEGVFLGRMDTLKKDEHFPLLEKVEWDAIVIDEAHRIEMPKTLRHRYVELAKANEKVAVILLSATPHRGKESHYLRLLSALDPAVISLVPRKRGRGAKPLANASFYVATHNVLVYRRTKEDVNTVYERREVFKPAKMFTVLLKPTEAEAKLLNDLVAVGTVVVNRFNELVYGAGREEARKLKGITGLLTMLLVKRGTSSPKALAETFTKVTTKRAGSLLDIDPREVEKLRRMVRAALEPDEYEEELEEEPDEVFNKLAETLLTAELLPGSNAGKLVESLELAKKFVSGELEDSKIAFLTKLVDLANGSPSGELADLRGAKIIVFTEFKDTAYYVYDRLLEALGRRYRNAFNMVRVLTSENKGEYKEVVEWLEKPGVKVLVATDVMSEGLNLQQANVLVNYEVTYSPVRLEQRVGRVWRYGQRRTVYVFNLFYLHEKERKVHDIFFRKVYAITESLGKQELGLGEEVYFVTVHNTIFDEMLRRELGSERGAEVARSIGALPLAKLAERARKRGRGRPPKHTMDEIILRLMLEKGDEYERYLARLASEFVREMITVAETIRRTKVYPGQSSREEIEELLEHTWGIRNTDEAVKLAEALYDVYYSITGDPYSPRNFVEKLHAVRSRCNAYQAKTPMLFAVEDESKKLYMLYRVAVSVGGREVSDVVLVELDVDKGGASVKRGLRLVEEVRRLLPSALLVDEVHGRLRDTVEELGSVALLRAFDAVKLNKALDRVRLYEDAKRELFGRLSLDYAELFATKVKRVRSELLVAFFTTGLLPKSKYVPQTGVWAGFEKRYLVDIVLRFEGTSGRKPKIVGAEEHYDVYSTGGNEERYIECKGFTEPRLSFYLTEREYNTARELGDRYWLYLVYGVGTDEPAVLAIKNPAKRLKMRQEVYEVKVIRYTFSTS